MSRLLAEPLPVEVKFGEGHPLMVSLPGGAGSGRPRPVARVFSRWRVETDWWRTPVAREYWKVELGDGAGPGVLCELYRDRLTGAWWLTRVYD